MSGGRAGGRALDLPPDVAAEVKYFFRMCLNKMKMAGLSPDAAAELLCRITGSLVVSNALQDKSVYDEANKSAKQVKGARVSHARRAH